MWYAWTLPGFECNYHDLEQYVWALGISSAPPAHSFAFVFDEDPCILPLAGRKGARLREGVTVLGGS